MSSHDACTRESLSFTYHKSWTDRQIWWCLKEWYEQKEKSSAFNSASRYHSSIRISFSQFLKIVIWMQFYLQLGVSFHWLWSVKVRCMLTSHPHVGWLRLCHLFWLDRLGKGIPQSSCWIPASHSHFFWNLSVMKRGEMGLVGVEEMSDDMMWTAESCTRSNCTKTPFIGLKQWP